ncbi:MAG: molybdopterin molybdotransferase MoeA [Proteobacteria bacterium]|nr:molybdopterin molybdotransferase MoeA [Pseudomonadota bacterium]
MIQPKQVPLIPLRDAFEKLLVSLPKIHATESVALLEATGRVLAEDLVASVNVPPHANSAMDGYAVQTADLAVDAAVLHVTQRIVAGRVGLPLAAGEAARIFTGAPLPEGADAVVMQENCVLNGDRVEILQIPEPGDNVRRAGEDVRAGEVLLPAGHRLRAQDIGLAASTGLTELSVKRKLRVALMTTGDELVAPGTELKEGQIYNSNFFAIFALLKSLHAEVIELGVIEDDFVSTRQALEEAADQVDCIISTGGVSVGDEDHVKAAVEAVGQLELWSLAIKPGKPFASGKVLDAQFFGLPGNPVSAFVTFVLLVRPCLLTMLGCNKTLPATFLVPAGFACGESGQRQEYIRAYLKRFASGATKLVPFDNQSSGVAASLSRADGLAIIPPYTSIAKGDDLEFISFAELLV